MFAETLYGTHLFVLKNVRKIAITERVKMPLIQSLESLMNLSSGSPMPTIPKPASLQDKPNSSPKIVVSTTAEKLNVLWDSDHSSTQFYVVDPDPSNPSGSNNAVPASAMIQWWGARPDYTLTMRRYWQVADMSQVAYDQTYNKILSETNGISTTEEQSMSYEVGVEFKGISAKFSQNFSTSITVSQENNTSESWGYTNTQQGTVAYAILWQLIEEYAALDSTGRLVTWPRGVWASRYSPDPMVQMDGALLLTQNLFTSPTTVFVQDITSFTV